MDTITQFSHFITLDYAAVLILLISWALIGYLIDNAGDKRPSVSNLMAQYRREWMIQMINRDPRIFDAQILASLRQGTSFFASATMIAIGGCLALLGNTEQLTGIARDLTLESDPNIVWDVKILIILVFLANAFLKFVWSNRLFGYCAVLIASVPNDPEHPEALPRAKQAGEINITGARSFNRGLRSVYFALASAAWLLGPEALIIATLITCIILFRREFASQSHKILMQPEYDNPHTYK
jgi:uncharacterized membrane protein